MFIFDLCLLPVWEQGITSLAYFYTLRDDCRNDTVISYTTWTIQNHLSIRGSPPINPHDWRPYMKAIRKEAFVLRDAGKVRILQKGIDVAGSEAVGPIRIQIK